MHPASSAERLALRPNSVVSGRYRIEAPLGEGGAASVYRARDEQTGGRVALKQLRLSGTRTDALLTSLFEREYHTLSQLAHPSIIEVYDYGVDAGAPYYTMELLDGDDLRERGPLSFTEVCALVADVASSLAILHSRGRVHRDVSPRNVRCTRTGAAKLIDFGAMAPIGVAQPLVGTPPFVPPEAVQLQALDGRVDLFALGALLYFMLTGRHAYPAQAFAQLRDLWRTAPPTPRQYDPSIPEALDRLVMELLQLERAARPRSAAEVMERLSAISGRPLAELPAVTRAYLAAPVLVGRERALQQVRSSVLGGMRARGNCTLIEAAPGMGRSRMLDACVLEAKLLGAVVLRANTAARGQAQEYGLAADLCAQLLSAMPVLAEQAARPRRSLLSHVIPRLGTRVQEPQKPPARRLLQAALRDFFLTVAREQHVVLAIDDLERADEASAALLGMLAHGAARRKLSLFLTCAPDDAPPAALALLRKSAQRLELGPLDAAQTRALVKSLFGDVEHSDALASRVHALSGGSPRWLMALCERLVERGAARYHAGRWTLPAELGPELVPGSLALEFAARIAALSDDARALGQLLSLTDPSLLALPDFAPLGPDCGGGRTYRALDELVAAAVLVATDDRYRFSQPEFVRLLREGIGDARARELHARLAGVFAGKSSVAQYAEHLLLSGAVRDAVDVALPAAAALAPNWSRRASELLVRTLAGAVEARSEPLSPRLRTDATFWLLILSVLSGDRERYLQSMPGLLERISHDSGLADFDTSLQQGTTQARMLAAQARAAQRYVDTPQDERVYSPQEALARMMGLVRATIGMAAIAQELPILERLPSLSPLAAISPLASVIAQEVELMRANLSGRWEQLYSLLAQLQQRLAEPDRAGLLPHDYERLRLTLLYMEGLSRAGVGIEVPAELLTQLEHVAGYRAHAWRVRMTSELMRCNFDAARDCERRAELINLQDGGVLPGSTLRTELLAHGTADNLAGMQATAARIEELAGRYPGWQPTLAVARSTVLRLQGDLESALVALQPALELARAGEHPEWEQSAFCHMLLLRGLGRAHQAVLVFDREFVRDGVEYPISQATHVELADALREVGQLESATLRVDNAIAEMIRRGVCGLQLGLAYETRARVAIAARDTAALHMAAERCAHEFKVGANSPMNARYERLLREAHAEGMELPASAQWLATAPGPAARVLSRTVHSRMLTCIGEGERAREVLNLLLEESGAGSGYLFGLRSGQLRLMANVDEAEVPKGLSHTLERYLCDELESDQSPGFAAAQRGGIALQPWVDAWGREFEPLLLVGRSDGERAIAGVAALNYQEFEHSELPHGLLEALAEALLAEDIVDPITSAGL